MKGRYCESVYDTSCTYMKHLYSFKKPNLILTVQLMKMKVDEGQTLAEKSSVVENIYAVRQLSSPSSVRVRAFTQMAPMMPRKAKLEDEPLGAQADSARPQALRRPCSQPCGRIMQAHSCGKNSKMLRSYSA